MYVNTIAEVRVTVREDKDQTGKLHTVDIALARDGHLPPLTRTFYTRSTFMRDPEIRNQLRQLIHDEYVDVDNLRLTFDETVNGFRVTFNCEDVVDKTAVKKSSFVDYLLESITHPHGQEPPAADEFELEEDEDEETDEETDEEQEEDYDPMAHSTGIRYAYRNTADGEWLTYVRTMIDTEEAPELGPKRILSTVNTSPHLESALLVSALATDEQRDMLKAMLAQSYQKEWEEVMVPVDAQGVPIPQDRQRWALVGSFPTRSEGSDETAYFVSMPMALDQLESTHPCATDKEGLGYPHPVWSRTQDGAVHYPSLACADAHAKAILSLLEEHRYAPQHGLKLDAVPVE